MDDDGDSDEEDEDEDEEDEDEDEEDEEDDEDEDEEDEEGEEEEEEEEDEDDEDETDVSDEGESVHDSYGSTAAAHGRGEELQRMSGGGVHLGYAHVAEEEELELMELEYDEAGAGRPVTDGQAGRCASSKSDPCLCPGPWLYP